MLSLVTQADGSSRGQPWVTYALALVLVAGFAWVRTADLAESTASIETELDEAVAYFESHPYLELDPRLVARAGGDQAMEEMRESFMSERRTRGLSLIPASIKRRAQSKFDAAVEVVFAARQQLPDWRLGVVDASSPPANWFAHFIATTAAPGLIVALFFLLGLAGAVEGRWGSLALAGFCAIAIPLGATTYVQLQGGVGVPWYGAGGLVAALLGAYFISSLGQPARFLGALPMPGWLMVAGWIPAEYVIVRGLSLGDMATAPITAHAALFGFGAAVAMVIRLTGLEANLRAKDRQNFDLVANPVLDRAMATHATGRTAEAYEMLKAEVEIHPRHHDLVLGLWTIARECGAESEAAPHLLEIVRQELKRGKRSEAAEHWLELSEAAPHVSVEPALLVRLGEALLDEGQPNDALLTMARALEEPDRVPAPLARRIVRITRDLDPQITGRAAAAALRDDHLDPDERAELESLSHDFQPIEPAQSIQPSAVRSSESVADPALTASGAIVTAAASSPSDGTAKLDAKVLSSDSLSAEVVSPDEGEVQRSVEYWNDSGLIEDLSTELEDDPDPFDASGLDAGYDTESFGAVDLADASETDDLAEAADDAALNALAHSPDDARLTDAPSGFLVGPETSDADAEEAAEDGSVTAPMLDHEEGHTTAVEGLSEEGSPSRSDLGLSSRRLKVLEGVPVWLDDDGIKVEIDGRGKTRLPLERLEALGVAAVGGLGERSVLLVDLVLNWLGTSDEPLKVIRLRSDRFNPRTLVPEAESAVAALKTLLARLLDESSAAPLPSIDAVRGDPFASYPDLASYHKDVLLVTDPD